MYFIYGLFVWVVSMVVMVGVVRFYPMFQTNVEDAREDIRELINELAETNFTGFMIMGAISLIIILGWPIIIAMIALALLVFCLGGAPYLLFRKIRTSEVVPEPETDWIVPTNDVPRRNTTSTPRK